MAKGKLMSNEYHFAAVGLHGPATLVGVKLIVD
jgi:hypothetical protein